MQKAAKFQQVSEELNKKLSAHLEEFANNTEWTDIKNWLATLQSYLKQHPSPFINEKVLLSKRLNQCINPILPHKLHDQVLTIHETLFYNMRNSVDNDINEYRRLFAQDLGIYSVSILPCFAHSTQTSQRLLILKMLNEYYLDLGYQLIPMLMGLIKVLMPVYTETNEGSLLLKIEEFIDKLILKSGRRYVLSSIWSCTLKFSDCRLGGMHFLARLIPKMVYRKDEEEFESSHGFSKEEEELKQQLELEHMGVQVHRPTNQQHNILERPKSTYSNDEKKMPFEFENATFSQMELPEYIIKKPNSTDNIPVQRKVKRSQTMTTARNFAQEDGPKQPFSPEVVRKQLMNNSVDLIKEHLQSVAEERAQKSKSSQGEQKERKSGDSQKREIAEDLKKNEHSEHASDVKLNTVPVMEMPGIDILKLVGEPRNNENDFPSHNTLTINAIIACLQDPSQFIRRAALDFMFTHLRLKSEVLDEQDKEVLTQAVIRLFRKQQMSIIKRVDRWLLGRENQNGQYDITQKNEFVLPLITLAFGKILSKEPASDDLCINPIKVVQNFYTRHENLISLTIDKIFLELIRYIFNYSEGFEFSGDILRAGNRFFSNIPSHYPVLFRSLGSTLLQAIRTSNDHSAYQCVRYIDYCYMKLMKHEHGVEEIQYITVTLELLSQALSELAKMHKDGESLYRIYLKDLNLLIYNLISRRESVQRFMEKEKQQTDKKLLSESGLSELPAERLSYQKTIKQQQQKQRQKYREILSNIEVFYILIGNIIKVVPDIQMYEDIYRLCSMSIIKILNHLPTDIQIKELPQWFSAIEYGIRVSSPSVSLAAIDSLIKCLLYSDRHPIYNQFKVRIMDDKSKKVGNDYQNLALQKLWALLDYPHMHSKILDLIVAFSKFFPYEFTQTVQKSFETHSDHEKEASIQRFSHFWRLTGFKYKDLLISNRQFAELNKVGLYKMLDFLDDPNPLVRHAAKNWMMESLPLFHRVIEPLFYEIMKAAGDWYVTPKGLIVIKEAYDTKTIFHTFRRIRSLLSSGTYSFLKYVYQQPISDSLEDLRERVTHITEPILKQKNTKLEISKQASEKELKEDKKDPFPDKTTEKSVSSEIRRLSYIDLLIILAVRYIQGYTLESMGIDFYSGNTGVCTSAIQLLDSLINYIDNPSICYKFIEFILPPLSKVLSQSVINQEYITQIQLLNLFKGIFFNSSFRKKATTQQIRAFFSNIFTKTVFLSSMLRGLKTPFSYVRAQFVNFITSCIELIANFLEPDQCTKCIKEILLTYYKIIKEIRISLIEEVLDGEDKKNQKISVIEKEKSGLSQIAKLQIRAMQQEKITKISNNLQEVAKTNEILSILHGVSSILNYFYDLDKMSIAQMKFSFENPSTFFDSFKSIITLGFATSNKSGRLVQHTQFLHSMDTAQSILKDLSPVYETILRAWPLSEQFVRIATEQFTSIGSRTFNFEKFSRYNRVLKDLIEFVSREKESIWGKIFSIMQPMFYRFPRDIMLIYLHLWVRQCTNSGDSKGPANLLQPLAMKANTSNTEFLMKNIETIVVSNFPIKIIVIAFLESDYVQEIRKYYAELKQEKKQSLTFRISQLEAKLIYFLYIYFTYSYIDEKSLTKDSLVEIWGNIMKALKPFQNSKSPTTALWILDFINMCAVKYSPKEILVNEKFKAEVHAIVNKQLKYIASIASKKEIVFYDDPSKTSFTQGEQANQKYRVVLPIPPTIFEIYKAGPKQRRESDQCLFMPTKAGDYVQLQKINRLWCFRVLKNIGFEVLQNTYLAQKMHFAVIRACEWMEIILPTIEDKAVENMIYAESASEVLYHLLEESRLMFIKPLKSSIFRIFDKDDFFICNKNTLRYWAQIIDWIVSFENKNETFAEYLEKASLSNSYFTSATAEDKKRIKSFERICFILYSGAQDKYASKIKGLLEKITDIIKQAEASHPGLLILVLFAVRILILRLSDISLNQLFIDIWPMIMAFLMQIFAKKMVKVEIANQISRNPNLLLAALKLIESISVSNMTEFAHHQWIFIYDYFGTKISLMESTSEFSQIFSERPELTELASFTRSQMSSPFQYKPSMNNYIAHHSVSFLAEKKDEVVEYKGIKRKIIIKQSSISNEDYLRCYAYLLAQYLVRLNEYRIEADLKEIEEVIINDFISLDSFIYKS